MTKTTPEGQAAPGSGPDREGGETCIDEATASFVLVAALVVAVAVGVNLTGGLLIDRPFSGVVWCWDLLSTSVIYVLSVPVGIYVARSTVNRPLHVRVVLAVKAGLCCAALLLIIFLCIR